MTTPVKPEFPRRREKARATRRAVLDAAREMFVADGYAATTIQALADRADVAVQTVYANFGNKRAILDAVLDVTIAGDDAEITVNAREWMRPVFEAPTAAERLRGYAGAVRQIMERAGDVFTVVSAAADTDPDAVALARQTEDRRRMGAASVVDSVTQLDALRPGLSIEHAIDVLWMLNSPALFRQFVRHAGWSPDQYEAWLAEAMVRELLGEQPTTKRTTRRA